MFVQVVQPVYRVTDSQGLVRAYEKLAFVFVESEKLAIICVSLFVTRQILLDVLEDSESTT